MRAVIAFLAVVAVAEAAALLVLMSSGPGPAPLDPAAPVTVTVVRTAAPAVPAPAGPATITPTAELPDDVAALKERVGELELTLAQERKAALRMRDIVVEKVKENEEMRNELAALRRNGPGRLRVPPDPAPGVPDEELTEAQARKRALHLAMLRLGNLWVIGHGVPDGPWSEAQAKAIETAMNDELRRRDLVLRDFIRSSLRDEAPKGLAAMSGRQMMDGVIRPRMNGDFRTMQGLTPHQHVKLIRGEKGLGELLGADAWTVRLGEALAAMRRRTHADVGRADAEHGPLIAKNHLPLGSYRYSDGVEIEIGTAR
jgi:hypothetical protein